jgi:adenylate kinase
MALKKFRDFGNEIPYVMFVGAPGSGKGTQAEDLVKKTGYVHVSTGDILRKSKDDEIKDLMKTGKLLPDNIVSKELDKFIKDNKKAKGFIFDGYPRNIKQKDLLDKITGKNNLSLIKVYYMDVPEDILKERIKERGKTSGRADDKDTKVFNTRMEEFYDQTLPLINLLKQDLGKDKFLTIKGDSGLEKCKEKISKDFLKSVAKI